MYAISSAIETEESETGGKQRRTAVNRVLRQVAESERVGDQQIKSVKNGKTDSKTPTLSESLFLRESLRNSTISSRARFSLP